MYGILCVMYQSVDVRFRHIFYFSVMCNVMLLILFINFLARCAINILLFSETNDYSVEKRIIFKENIFQLFVSHH